MSWNTVHLSQVPASPWRNGGGVTRELVVWPEQGDWTWRMSVAEVASSGPFSKFEGVQRWFAVLQGVGVRLDVNGAIHRVTAADAPLEFDGEATTTCTLLNGTTQDFNLMVRKDVGVGHMERIQGQFGVSLNASKIIAIYAIGARATVQFDQKSMTLEPNTLVWRHVPPYAKVLVDAVQALWMEIPV